MAKEQKEHPDLDRMVKELTDALGGKLRSVVLYGSAARGEFRKKASDYNLIAVLEDLEPAPLEKLTPVLWRWGGKRQPAPRLFTEALIADSADVFPIEFLDILAGHRVLHGKDPFAKLTVRKDHLRLQCERELREKMMRLRESYAEFHDRAAELERLLRSSYSTFVALFRGCLHLLGGEVPQASEEVVAAFCERAGIEPGPFAEVERLRRGEEAEDPKDLFGRYYRQLERAVAAVDRFAPKPGGGSQR
jgi:hypothetical protein